MIQSSHSQGRALGVQNYALPVVNETSTRQANKFHCGGEVKNVILRVKPEESLKNSK